MNGGILRLGTNGSLASATSLVMGTATGAAFDLNGRSQEVASLSGGGATGGNVTLGSGTLTVNLGSAASYAGAISGGGGLTKTGSAILTLTGTNTYEGATTVNGGILRLGTNGSLASATSLVLGTASGAAFDLNGRSQTVASLNGGGTSGGNVALGTGRLTVNGGGTFGGVISGQGGLTKTGTGVLTLTAANTYQNTTNIDGGVLQLGAGGSLLSTATVLLGTASGAAFDLNGQNQTVAQLSGGGTTGGNVTLGSGTLTVNLSGSASFGGVMSGTDGKLVKTGGGTFTLTNANTYTGTTTISDGVLNLGVGGSINNSSRVILAGGSLSIDGNNTTANTNNVELGSGTSTLTVAAGQVLSWTTALTGSGDLQIGNSAGGAAGRFNLGSSTSNWSSYTGTIVATNVVVDIKGGTIGGSGSELSIGQGATLQGTGTFGGDVAIGTGGTLSVGNSPGTQTYGSLSLTGTSKFELGAANKVGNDGAGSGNDLVVVTGALTLGGTLQLLPSGSDTIANGYYRLFNYGSLTASSFASVIDKDGNPYASGIVTVLSNISNQINIRFNAQQQTQYWTGTDLTGNTGTSPVDQALGGGGTWTAGTSQTNWSDSSGAEIHNAWLGGVAAFGGTTAGTVAVDSSGGAVDVQGLSFTTTGYAINGATPADALTLTGNASAGHVNLTTMSTLAGITATLGVKLVGSTVDKGLVKTGDGTLVLSGANTYTGMTKVEAGTLQVNASGSISNSSGLALAKDTTFKAGGTIAYGNAVTLGIAAGSGSVTLDVGSTAGLTFNGTIGQFASATMALTKTGGGTLTLNGASTASGGFSLAEGTVEVGHNAALGMGTVSLAAATTLKARIGGLTLGNAIGVSGNASVDTNAVTLTLGGAVTGTGRLKATGGGTLSLTNMSTDRPNTFAGGLTVDGGTTVLNQGALIGAITLDNGTLKAATDQTRTNALTIGSGGGTLDGTAGRLTFAGTMDGSGVLTTKGNVVLSGTALTGYTGALTVSGALSVASGATVGTDGQTVTVANGGTLGGTGIVRGAVVVQGGGKLAAGNSPGTITVAGSLALGNNSSLDVDLTGAGIVGGSANDLTTIKKVGGSGGTLTIGSNVTVNLSSSSTTGYYRLINYEGTRSGTFATVTKNGSALTGGTTGTVYYIEQAGSAGQANLLYKSANQSLLFFTGANLTGNTGDGPSSSAMTPAGGAGVWTANQTNWTTAPAVGTSGSSPGSEINGNWQQGVAVFMDSLAASADRTVTVANNAASVEGLQFVTSGYTLTGGSLTLFGDSAPSGNPDATFIRTEAGVTATIGTVLQDGGAGIGLDKTGTGTLILTGANTFTGAVTVQTGTLVVGNNDALGSAGGAVATDNTVTLMTNTTLKSQGSADLALRQSITIDGSTTVDTNGKTLTLSGALSKTSTGDTLTKAGAGNLRLSGDSSGFGGIMQVSTGSLTLVSGGKLTVSSLTVGSGTRLTVESGATLRGTGNTITNNDTVVTAGALLDDTMIVNNATIQASGVLYAPTVDNKGTFTVTGALSGAAPVGSGGTAMTFNNAAGKTLDLGGAGRSFTGIGTLNNSGTVVMTGGTLGAATFNNNATANLAGTLNVTQFNNAATLTLNGNITGATTNLANLSGATITLNNNSFGGIGTLTNAGTIVGSGTLTGALAGTGTIDLRPSGPTNLMQDTTQVLTVGQLTGNQTVLIALDPGSGKAGKIVSTGGSTAGSSLTFLIQQTTLRPTASAVTLAQGLGAGTTVTAKAQGFSFDVGFVNTKLVNPSTGLWQVTTTVSPNAGAPAASIGSVITSLSTGFFSSTNAFVTSPSDTAANATHGGPWVRIQAGQYDTQSATTVSFGSLSATAQTKVRTSFSGFQVGADYGVLNVGGSGVNLHAGVMAGSVSANGAQQNSAAPTKGSFSVPFVGGYTALVAGAFSADLQYRRDFYSMDISNAVGFTGTFQNHKADGQSVNGSATYRISLSDTMFLEPGVGFNYTRVDVDPFKAGKPGTAGVVAGSITMQTVESLLGRASLRAGYTTVIDDKLIVQPFVTAAVWHEFAKDQLSTFTFSETGENVKITAGRVGTFGQAGLGVTGQVIGTNLLGYIRTDARFGDRIRGGSINMGIRYDF